MHTLLQFVYNHSKAFLLGFLLALLGFAHAQPGAFTPYGLVNVRFANPSALPAPSAVVNPSQALVLSDTMMYSNIGDGVSPWIAVYRFGSPLTSGYGLSLAYNKYWVDTTLIMPRSAAYTKSQANGLFYSSTNPSNFISSYTETDPIWTGVASTYRTKVQNDALYQPIGSYLTSETDPTVPSYVKAITTTEKSNWNTAYSWGNHNGLYPLLSGSYSNPSWISSLAATKVTGLSTVATTGNYSDLIGKPTIPAAQVNSDWNSSLGISVILNKPTNVSVFTNDANYVTSSSLTSTLLNYVLSSTYTTGLAGKENSITAGTTSQYWRGDKTWQILDKTSVGLSNVDNTSDATKNSATATLINKSMSGSSNTFTNISNSALINSTITINGNNVSLGGSTVVTASPSIGPPTSGISITSGTAFQPRSGGPCGIVINSSLGSGLAAVTGTIVIAMSSTSGGTYTTVTTDGLILSLLSASLDRSSATIPVPSGWWVKVTTTTVGVGATISSTYTKWDY